MTETDKSVVVLDVTGPAWARAALAAHTEERRLRAFIAEMHKLADAVVIRLLIIAHSRMKDGTLPGAVELRDRLGREARTAPLLGRWERLFASLERRDETIETDIDDYLEPFFDQHGLTEAERDQYRFRPRARRGPARAPKGPSPR